MKTLLLQGEGGLPANRGTLDLLRSVCSRLIEQQYLGRCLAVLPTDRESRAGVLSFLQELKHGGSVRVAAILVGRELTSSVLTECLDAGLEEIVILQGAEEPLEAIAQMRRVREVRGGSAAPAYRLWLDPAAAGHLQSRARAWEHYCPSPESVEVAPFPFAGPTCEPAADGGEPVSSPCDWQRGVITVNSFDSLLPCPAHSRGIPLDRAVLRSVTLHPGSPIAPSGSSGVCGDCRRLVRFAIPEWMWSSHSDARAVALPAAPVAGDEPSFGDLGKLSPSRREHVLSRWLERVKESAEGEVRP